MSSKLGDVSTSLLKNPILSNMSHRATLFWSRDGLHSPLTLSPNKIQQRITFHRWSRSGSQSRDGCSFYDPAVKIQMKGIYNNVDMLNSISSVQSIVWSSREYFHACCCLSGYIEFAPSYWRLFADAAWGWKKDFCLLCMFTTNKFIFSRKDGSKANIDTFAQFVFSAIQQCLH